jgi:phospholipase C
MRTPFWGLIVAGLMTLCSVAWAGAVEPTYPGAGVTSAIDSTSPIKHVVIIYQENHTFDDALGAMCQTRADPCNGYTGPVTFADGLTATNEVQPDIVPSIGHSPESQARALSNEWDTIDGCQTAPYPCISHSDPANMPNLTALAESFAVSDATFAAGGAESFGEHINLLAGTMDGFVGFNPIRSTTGATPLKGWGCLSQKDALWAPPTGGTRSYQPSCIPSWKGTGPYRTSQVGYVPTVLQRLEKLGWTWHLYQGTKISEPTKENLWSVCTYFAWCENNRDKLAYNSATRDFITAAAAGTLPNLSVMLPLQGTSQHNLDSMAKGDNYIGSIVSAAENGPEWNSTAIFITYDDCGCFYDHVTPPAGLGLRDPMIIVSPWAKAASTDSTTAIQPYSMVSFIQHLFGLRSLTPAVDNAYDYADSFDFTQTPTAPVHMTRSRISERERARLKAMPKVHDLT